MVYFIRARTHYSYAQRLLQEVIEGKKPWSKSIAQDIFKQALKAIYSLTEISPPKEELTVDELIKRVLPTLSQDERDAIQRIKEKLHSAEAEREQFKADLIRLLEIVKKCLEPIL